MRRLVSTAGGRINGSRRLNNYDADLITLVNSDDTKNIEKLRKLGYVPYSYDVMI